MRSLIACSSALLLALVVAAPARAALPVTTSETDSGEPSVFVVIVDPVEGAVLEGTPDATIPVVIEYQTLGGGLDVTLEVDGTAAGDCGDQDSPCTLEVTLTPGAHALKAISIESEHTINVTVEDQGSTESSGGATDSSGGATDSTGGDTSPTTGSTPTTETGTDGNATDATEGTDGAASASGGEGDDDKGCACSTRSSTPDLLGLALVALFAPWRRRRHA